MQIKFGMAAFRCDNYGFICKLSLLLMLRDIKISSNGSIREDHVCWRSADSNNMRFSRHQRSVNKHSFRQPCAAEAPRRVQSRSKCLRQNIYIFPVRLDIPTSRRFHPRVTHKQRQRTNFYCHLIPWNLTGDVYNCFHQASY